MVELEAALDALAAAWTPELSAHVRSGRQIGRNNLDDPVRVARCEMVRETRRLRNALHRATGRATSGTPTPQVATLTPSRPGHLARFHREINTIASDHEAAVRVLSGSKDSLSAHLARVEHDKERSEALDRLRRARLILKHAMAATRPGLASRTATPRTEPGERSELTSNRSTPTPASTPTCSAPR